MPPRAQLVRPRTPESDEEEDDRPESEEDGEDEKDVEDERDSAEDDQGDVESEELEEEEGETVKPKSSRVNVAILQDEDEDAQSNMEIDDEEEPEDDELSNESSSQVVPSASRLKIKLKLPVVPASSASNTATPVPDDLRQQHSPSKRTSGRSRKVVEYQESSEDEGSNDDMSISEESTQASPSKRLTSRQAALANAVDTSHVSLTGESAPTGRQSRKKQLNETELALRREETARKRKNMTEKKLEDEKAETINRLLKKQTRPRAKRTATGGTAGVATPKMDASKAESAEEDMEVDEIPPVPPPAPEIPTMYRWVSTSRPPKDGMEVEGATPVMSIVFGVPPGLVTELPPVPLIKPKSLCGVEGCGQDRKYRLVQDWERGACGMAHLKMLQAS